MRARTHAMVGVLLFVACRGSGGEGRFTKEAQRQFSSQYSCPADRVTITPRKDLKAYDLQVGPSSPPPDVASDPGRLAEWKKHEDKTRAGYDDMRVIQTSGCDHKETYVCSYATGTNEQQTVACSTAAYPPP